MKKLILLLIGFLLLAAIFIFYPEFKTRNFVDAFITSSDNLEEVVQGMTIWEDGENSMGILKQDDEQYDEVLSAIRDWEVKRTLFKDMDHNQKMYQLDIIHDVKSMDSLNIIISNDGMLNIRGQEYELVNGSSIEEIIEITK
ncbi:hypothetical protein [Lysinibacillus sp. SGAir0095]|uniref:hypothetical protein n=1 Tax=Lysinibacillus sp. SGAir0095 TaxID=2070463 RepID=UPI0010CD0E27|nr:hypothetical protein [Lysinibacillus sp. SGAir0095]QCR31109.1 hypothetical protein C1N55_02590 [Lysinibacillus sp. SGAir0095]